MFITLPTFAKVDFHFKYFRTNWLREIPNKFFQSILLPKKLLNRKLTIVVLWKLLYMEWNLLLSLREIIFSDYAKFTIHLE